MTEFDSVQFDFKMDIHSKKNFQFFYTECDDFLELIKKISIKRLILLDIEGVDHKDLLQSDTCRLHIMYSFLCPEEEYFIKVDLSYRENCLVPSLSFLYPAAAWSEREVAEMFGVRFTDRPERLLTTEGTLGYPLLKDFVADFFDDGVRDFEQISKWEKKESVCISDQTSFEHKTFFTRYGELGLSVELSADEIQKIHSYVGFQHRGIEKILETKSYAQGSSILSFLNPKYRVISELLWTQSVEEIFALHLTERAQAVRMILLELSRIKGHLLTLKEISAAIGGGKEDYLFVYMIKEIEEFTSSLGPDVIIVGGVKENLPTGWQINCLEMIVSFLKYLDRTIGFYTRSNVFKSRTSVGTISKNLAVNFSASGYLLRASGVNFDLRKTHPFYFYKDVDFDVPLGVRGEVYDRFIIMLEEIRQSIRIVEQVVAGLPQGKSHCWSGHGEIKTNFELIEHFNHFCGKFGVAKKEVSTLVEGGNGLLGISVIPGRDRTPYRVKVKTPSFFHLQLFEKIVEGEDLDNLDLILKSMGICVSEVDR